MHRRADNDFITIVAAALTRNLSRPWWLPMLQDALDLTSWSCEILEVPQATAQQAVHGAEEVEEWYTLVLHRPAAFGKLAARVSRSAQLYLTTLNLYNTDNLPSLLGERYLDCLFSVVARIVFDRSLISLLMQTPHER
jgi:hypothetical protein